VTLLVLALCVRALVPEGFMPAQGALVELCTEHGLQRMLVDPQTGEVLAQEEGAVSPTCPWSLMLPTLAPPASAIGASILSTGRDRAARPTRLELASHSTVLPPARGPPPLA